MAKLTLWQNVSIDGYVGTGDEDIEWMSIDDELYEDFNRAAREASTFVYGRVSYEIMLSYWPFAEDDADAPDHEREFSRIWKPKPKVVLSRTLAEADWNTTIVSDDIPGELGRLVSSAEGELMMMGGSEAPSLLAREGLLDELRLYVHPAALGGGEPLFSGLERPLRLKPLETRSFDSGVILLRHEVL